MHPKQRAEMLQNIQGYLDQSPPFQGRQVLIFGHCNASEELCDHLLSQGVTPRCFLDNNVSKQGSFFQQIPIQSPQYIQTLPEGESIVLIASRFYHPMCKQLRQLSYQGEVVETVEYNSFQAFSTEQSVFEQKKQRVLEGYHLWQQLEAQFPQHFFVLCPHQALGDVYWIMSYLPAYCQKHNIHSLAVVTVGTACGSVAKLFGYEGVLSLEQRQMDQLMQGVVLTQKQNVLIAHHNALYTDVSFRLLQGTFLPFVPYLRDVVLGLDDHARPLPPSCHQPFPNEEGLPQGRSVIFAPYANSIVEAPLSFWENLAQDYLAQGFSVYSNILPGQEVIAGTKPLCLPLAEMYSAVEWAGHFVSIRSGICDVVHRAKAMKTLVFPPCFFSTTPHKISDFFALEGWESILLEEVHS